MDILLKTRYSRVLNVSSEAHNRGNIDFKVLSEKFMTRPQYSSLHTYADTKFAQIEHTIYL